MNELGTRTLTVLGQVEWEIGTLFQVVERILCSWESRDLGSDIALPMLAP